MPLENTFTKPDRMLVEIGNDLDQIYKISNLATADIQIPTKEAFIQMVMEAAKNRAHLNYQALNAKLNDIYYGDANALVRKEIFVHLYKLAIEFVEYYNVFGLWSKSGFVLYEFEKYYDENTVSIVKSMRLD